MKNEIDESLLIDFILKTKRYNPSSEKGICGKMTECENGSFVRYDDVVEKIHEFFKQG